MRGHALLWTLVLCLTTAIVTSASAARRDAAITLALRPSVTALYQPITAYGKSGASYAGVTLQFKECGVYPAQFRDVAELPSTAGGEWSVSIMPVANGTFRATVGPNVSNQVDVRTRAHVRLTSTRPGRYRAYVEARQAFWHKRIRIERYVRSRSRWVPLRTVVLARTEAINSLLIKNVSSKSDEFAVKLPRGTRLRAVFPLSQAKPCYAAGTSEVVQR